MMNHKTCKTIKTLLYETGGTQPRCRRKTGRLAVFLPSIKGFAGFEGFVGKGK